MVRIGRLITPPVHLQEILSWKLAVKPLWRPLRKRAIHVHMKCNVESWTGLDSVIISSGAEQPRAVYPGATSSEVKVERGTAIEHRMMSRD